MKKPIYLLLIVFTTFFSSFGNAQSNSKHIDTFIEQIKEYPGQTLGFAAKNIYHIYDISIPKDAKIEETKYSYLINPVEVTMAVSNSVYDITKQKVNYKVTIFKENKGSKAMGRKDYGSIETIWQKKESTKEFSAELKALKNFDNSTFDELFGPEDSFQEDWKK